MLSVAFPLPPLQVSLYPEAVNIIERVEAVRLKLRNAVHPAASEIVNVYEPATRPVTVAVLAPFDQKYE
jgi:hypothetical protein